MSQAFFGIDPIRHHSWDDVPSQVRALWAKSGDAGGHGLLAHLLDVAAVAQSILRRQPESSLALVREASGLEDPENAIRWASSLVGLHDLGKATPGFQAKWLPGRAVVERTGLRIPNHEPDRHDAASAALLAESFRMTGSNPQRARALASAVAAHHGFFIARTALRGAGGLRDKAAWDGVRAELLGAYIGALEPPAVAEVDRQGFVVLNWLAGLTAISDWIGSATEFFSYGERGRSPIEHFNIAQGLAAKALDRIGWPKWTPLLRQPVPHQLDDLIARMVGSPVRARPLQELADRMLADVSGPVFMLVEAQMGEGKTELAFLAHLRLQQRAGHRGLYIALPTQATGSAMFERTVRFLQGFGTDQSLDIQ
ncbi:MAG: CRISPR-associated endonuclease Cas3'', partial [Burkholderiales bacterium]